jgi:dolichyl-phosphate-mannose-protein mannosyltransferase
MTSGMSSFKPQCADSPAQVHTMRSMSGVASPGLTAAPAPYVEPLEALQRIRAKLIRPLPDDRLRGWLLPLAITLLGGLLRFWRITRPGGPTLKATSVTGHGATAVQHTTGIVFDETYYAHDSWSLLHHGVETDGLMHKAAFIVHPPLGKWVMALGEAAFDHGKTAVFNGTIYPSSTLSFRFMGALLGTLAILMVARVARRMFHSTALGVIAGGLLALDGLEFVQSRTAMLDIYLLFWVLAAFCCLVIDRDDGRRRLANRLQRPLAPEEWGPSLGFRWWRWAAGICIGAACATKWNGVYYVFALLILAVVWDFGARRTAGARSGLWWGVLKSLGPALVAFIVVPIVVYVVSWSGWFASNATFAYDHDVYLTAGKSWFGLPQGGSHKWLGFLPMTWFAHDWAVFHGWWKYQTEIWYYDKTLHASHPYRSVPLGWLLLERPVAYYYETPAKSYCGGQLCAQEVLGIGNPAIWWACIPAFLAAGWMWIMRRDWRAAAVMTTFLFGFVPWVLQEFGNVKIPMAQGGPCTGAGDCHRTMFLYYMTPNIPFMVLALTFVIGLAIGHRKQNEIRRIFGTSAAALYLAAVIVLFGFFYPVLAGKTITYHQWDQRIWFQHSCQAGKWNEYHENAPCWI